MRILYDLNAILATMAWHPAVEIIVSGRMRCRERMRMVVKRVYRHGDIESDQRWIAVLQQPCWTIMQYYIMHSLMFNVDIMSLSVVIVSS